MVTNFYKLSSKSQMFVPYKGRRLGLYSAYYLLHLVFNATEVFLWVTSEVLRILSEFFQQLGNFRLNMRRKSSNTRCQISAWNVWLPISLKAKIFCKCSWMMWWLFKSRFGASWLLSYAFYFVGSSVGKLSIWGFRQIGVLAVLVSISGRRWKMV